PNGQSFVIWDDSQLHVRDIQTGETLFLTNELPGTRLKDVIWSEDGESLLIFSETGDWQIRRLADSRVWAGPQASTLEIAIHDAIFAPSGDTIAAVGKSAETWYLDSVPYDLYLYDFETRNVQRIERSLPASWKGKLRFSPDGSRLFILDINAGTVNILRFVEG
ncbi:MAG: hypothetical protein ACE5M4_13375, partial [Anaerolineales bacterium]